MPAADAAWLHMDRPTNPMVVNGLVTLGSVPSVEAVTEVIEERLVGRFPRFRQRVVDQLGRAPAFEDDPFFDLPNHLHRMVLPPPGDRATLEEMVSDLITPPLDPGKPLWHAYLIEGFDGGSAMLWRIHHHRRRDRAGEVMLTITDGPGAGWQRPEPLSQARRALDRLAAARSRPPRRRRRWPAPPSTRREVARPPQASGRAGVRRPPRRLHGGEAAGVSGGCAERCADRSPARAGWRARSRFRWSGSRMPVTGAGSPSTTCC
ncbi:MAG: wax ester/triacylglycerol synthase family O-acyltransferase [Solirubrobacterales bacterium]